jgi:hypothetical protein
MMRMSRMKCHKEINMKTTQRKMEMEREKELIMALHSILITLKPFTDDERAKLLKACEVMSLKKFS